MKRNAFVSGLLATAAAGLVLAAPRAEAACSATQSPSVDSSGTPGLKLVGDGNKNTLTINDSGTSVQVFLDCNSDTIFQPTDINGTVFTGVETVIIDLRALDIINYNLTGTWTATSRNVVLLLGPYGNTVSFNGTGAALQSNSSFFLDIQPGANLDVFNLDFSGATLTNSALFVWGDTGPGHDVFNVKIPNATNSEVDVDVELGQGNNKATFTASTALDNSTARGHISGSDIPTEGDIVASRFGATLTNNSRLTYGANLKQGDDQYDGVVDVSSLQLLNGSEARILVAGGFGNDFVTVSDGGGSGAAVDNGALDVSLRGGQGNDSLAFDLNGLTGSGTLRVREQGGIYNDSVLCSVATDNASTNSLDIVTQGGKGADIVYTFIYDAGGNATYGPGSGVWIDGGGDIDRNCIAFGNGSMELVNCEPLL
jgi:hypothetical protein